MGEHSTFNIQRPKPKAQSLTSNIQLGTPGEGTRPTKKAKKQKWGQRNYLKKLKMEKPQHNIETPHVVTNIFFFAFFAAK
jgi:hypothetical protein